VGSVLIAIDASRHIPLRVEVYPRGSSAVAYSIGFTALSFGTPAASNFSFTPPAGATVKNVTVPGNVKSILGQAGLGQGLGGPLLGSTIIGSTAIAQKPERPTASKQLVIGQVAQSKLVKTVPAIRKQALLRIEAQFAKSLPTSMSKAQRAAAIKAFDQHVSQHFLGRHVMAQLGDNGGGFFNIGKAGPLAGAVRANAPHVIGTGWLSVLATPPSPKVATAVKQALGGGQPRTTATYGSSTSPSTATASSSSLSVSSPAGPDLALLRALLRATVPVHGSWGSGRLLKTTLLTVLVTSKGQILAGAVTPSVLYADVAADAG
jgi:hypothetical protein